MIEDIQARVLELYGLDLELSLLYSYDDINLLGKDKLGRKYVIKIMHIGCDEDSIVNTAELLLHLQDHKLDIETPKLYRSRKQNYFERFEIEGQSRILWILGFCEGIIYAEYKPHSLKLVRSYGSMLAKLMNAMESFDKVLNPGNHLWCLTNSIQIKPYVKYVKHPIVETINNIYNDFEDRIEAKLEALPHSIIHNDANDYNVLVQMKSESEAEAFVSGIFDFGDLAYQPKICELAIALAYVIMGQKDPLKTCTHFLESFTQTKKIKAEEIMVLLPLIKTRLATSITMSFYKQAEDPQNKYSTLSQVIGIEALERIETLEEEFVTASFLDACGYEPFKNRTEILLFLEDPKTEIKSPINLQQGYFILDLSCSSNTLGADHNKYNSERLYEIIENEKKSNKNRIALGRYNEYRRLYQSSLFGYSEYETEEKRTLHLGLDIFSEAGTPVYAPLDAIVHDAKILDYHLDYGGVIMLKHETNTGKLFYTLYGHLSHRSIEQIQIGSHLEAGSEFARLGNVEENGHWPPHLHIQIFLNDFALACDLPGVVKASESQVWQLNCPNPAILFKDIDSIEVNAQMDNRELLLKRQKYIGSSLKLSYTQPIQMSCAFMQFMYDQHGQAYLDMYNNIQQVGHQNPRVVKAVNNQNSSLNTNSRYLHPNMVNYAEQLLSKFPPALSKCFFVNSASEANELALRLARNFTVATDMIVSKNGYHGHTGTLVDASHYKYMGPGGEGRKKWIHETLVPDPYRGKYKGKTKETGEKYASDFQVLINHLESEGIKPAGFITEIYPSVAGQIIPPPLYYKAIKHFLASKSILFIADEVQTGFGRLGSSFWAFEEEGIVPDIVVLGKPIGNGFPLAAVICKEEISKAFDNGMEFFSSYGGNPVACAAGLAVLQEIEEQDLQRNAHELGQYLLDELNNIKVSSSVIGDVRGKGLFIGVEIVEDKISKKPSYSKAKYIVERMKQEHILIGLDGSNHNVLKIRPPLVIRSKDIDHFIKKFRSILKENCLSIMKNG